MSTLGQTSATGLSSATYYEAAGRRFALDPAIRRLTHSDRVAARAYTVSCGPGDNLAIHRAIERVADGQVLVIGTQGATDRSYLGAVIATAAKLRGVAAIVLDGLVRDSDDLQTLGLPIYCRGAALVGATKGDPGEIGEETTCGGVAVCTGDLIVADGDGVVAIPARLVEGITTQAIARANSESDLLAALREGHLTVDLLALRDVGGTGGA